MSALRGNTVLTELRLEHCGIDAEETSHLAEALYGITTLRVLDLRRNTVDFEGARHLGKLSCELQYPLCELQYPLCELCIVHRICFMSVCLPVILWLLS